MNIRKAKSLILIMLSIGSGLAASLCLNLATVPVAAGSLPATIPAADTKLMSTTSSFPITAANPFGNLQTVSSPFPAMPKAPGVPKMPGALGAAKYNSHRLLGILYPDLVIVNSGNKTLTLPCNSDSEFGYIGSITPQGVYIDGVLVPLADNTKNNRSK